MADPITKDILSTRPGVQRYPDQAAALIAQDPPGLPSPQTDEVLSTRPGALRYPDTTAAAIAAGTATISVLEVNDPPAPEPITPLTSSSEPPEPPPITEPDPE